MLPPESGLLYAFLVATNKLLIEQTKSRPRHSNDNGLVEAKNGAVVRKHMGYTHIAAPHAATVNEFYKKTFNSYLNFHRPCGVPELEVNRKGKTKRVYRWYATPWEILRQLPDLAKHLKGDVTIQDLERQARSKTDTAAAEEMQKAKQVLFRCGIDEQSVARKRFGRHSSTIVPPMRVPRLFSPFSVIFSSNRFCPKCRL